MRKPYTKNFENMLKKSFGQHFLRDQSVIDEIIAALAPELGEVVVEVGPGDGALTNQLKDCKDLILIEADRDLIPALHDRFLDASIVNADAAQVDYDDLLGGRSWIFVSNLPYNAGNAILEKVFDAQNLPKRLIVMVQKEVGERMMAKPGDMGVLSVATQLFCDIERMCTVKPGAFSPPPKVDSVVLRLIPKHHNDDSRFQARRVIALAKVGFQHRRKQLRQTLAQAKVADISDIDAAFLLLGLQKTARPQELSLEQWAELSQQLNTF